MAIPIGAVPPNEHREWFRQLVDLGDSDLWSSESGGHDGFRAQRALPRPRRVDS